MFLAEGKVSLAYEFEKTGEPDFKTGKGAAGKAQLYINKKLVGETTLLVWEEAPCNTCMGIYNWTGKTLVVHTDTRAESDLGIVGWRFGAFWPHG